MSLISYCTFVIVIFLVACNSEPNTAISKGINVKEAKQMIFNHKGVVVLDVLTPKEFARGHITGAVNINIHDPAFPQHVSTLDRDKTYIVH